MLIVRSLRQDRVAFCVTSFIVSNLGSRFIEPPVLNMKLVSGLVSLPTSSRSSLSPLVNHMHFLTLSPTLLHGLLLRPHPGSRQVMEDSTPRTPLVFILSPGVDPTSALLQLAEHTGMAQRFHSLSLGQGQAPIAARLLRDGMYQGQWHSCSSTPILGPGPTYQSLQPPSHDHNHSSHFSRRSPEWPT